MSGSEVLRAALIDCGIVEREPSPTLDVPDLVPLDGVLYDRAYPRSVGNDALYVVVGLHDSGWQPIAIYRYCLRRPARAWPSKGTAEDDRSTAAPIRLGRPPPFVWEGQEYREGALRFALLNTYALKSELYGLVERSYVDADQERRSCVVLPVNVPDRFIAESASESLVRDATGRKWVWRARGPNHFADCNTQALAAALELLRTMDRVTREEQGEAEKASRRDETRSAATVEAIQAKGGGWTPPAAGGGWWTGTRR